MITVEPPPIKHDFPVLDFKFQNTGHAEAALWKFCLIIEHVDIDPQPELSGRVLIRPSDAKTLCAAITNDGWGTAYDCALTLSSPTLDLLFPVDARRRMKVSIPSGATYDLLIDHASLNQDEFVKLAASFRPEARARFEYKFPELVEEEVRFDKIRARKTKDDFDEVSARAVAEHRIRTQFDQSLCGVPVETMEIQYNLRDERNRRFSGSKRIWVRDGNIEVHSDGFVHHEYLSCGYASDPDTIYSCIIDVDRGAHLREYPTSRRVPSGHVDHFQIVVGATKSSHLKIKFQFYVDTATVVESKSFFLELWNPRNAGWDRRYKDGDAARFLAKAAAVKSRNDLSWDEIEVLREIEDLRNKAALDAFPFLLPSRDSRF
jgi:hypothetical protein